MNAKKSAGDRNRRPVLTSETTKRKRYADVQQLILMTRLQTADFYHVRVVVNG